MRHKKKGGEKNQLSDVWVFMAERAAIVIFSTRQAMSSRKCVRIIFFIQKVSPSITDELATWCNKQELEVKKFKCYKQQKTQLKLNKKKKGRVKYSNE